MQSQFFAVSGLRGVLSCTVLSKSTSGGALCSKSVSWHTLAMVLDLNGFD